MTDFETLIDVDTLAEHQSQADWIVLDCRFDLSRPGWGAEEFARGHVPRAQYADLDHDLAGPVGPMTGRHPLPAVAHFSARASAWSIDESVQVVAYDQGSGMFAARAWWLFQWLGHPAVAVLDGGYAAWCAAGYAVTADVPNRSPRRFVPQPDSARVADAAEVQMKLARGDIELIDARAADRFAGQNETIDPIAGHIPGASNHPFSSNLGGDGRFLSREKLVQRWHDALGGRPAGHSVAMCGSGVSACHNLLALEHAGLPGARLYAGSWSEWIRDPARPVATGA